MYFSRESDSYYRLTDNGCRRPVIEDEPQGEIVPELFENYSKLPQRRTLPVWRLPSQLHSLHNISGCGYWYPPPNYSPPPPSTSTSSRRNVAFPLVPPGFQAHGRFSDHEENPSRQTIGNNLDGANAIVSAPYYEFKKIVDAYVGGTGRSQSRFFSTTSFPIDTLQPSKALFSTIVSNHSASFRRSGPPLANLPTRRLRNLPMHRCLPTPKKEPPIVETPKRQNANQRGVQAGSTSAAKLPYISRPLSMEKVSETARLNLEQGIQNIWPRKATSVDVACDTFAAKHFWENIKYSHQALFLPEIIQDNQTTTCANIGLAFVKGILLILGARTGEHIVIKALNQGAWMDTSVTIKDSDFQNCYNMKPHEACLGLTSQEWKYISTFYSHWRVFARAFAVFSKRGVRKVDVLQLETIVKTVTFCQLAKYVTRKMNDPQRQDNVTLETMALADFKRLQEEIQCQQPALSFNCGVYQSFEVTLILSREYGLCNGSEARVDLNEMWNSPKAFLMENVSFDAFGKEIKEFYKMIRESVWRFAEDRESTRASPKKSPEYCNGLKKFF